MSVPAANVVLHPLVQTKLSILRDVRTSSKDFRQTVHDISVLLGYEASRQLQLLSYQGQTPVSQFTGVTVQPRVGLVPILRAGAGMTDALLSLHPEASVHHLGLFREKISLQAVEYYNKLGEQTRPDIAFLLDPMVATGHTALSAVGMLIEWGLPISSIKLVAIIVAEEGFKALRKEYPDLEIWCAGIDPQLVRHNDEEGKIAPGLGDAGDRLFNSHPPNAPY
ncbi:PRTase-like protein [Exidia glandulosa HHB12029]|uniref:uracil phosphoribosyltransferase n=1 Tax=Exidia glandulosa HHB12029 TaxID=1314781 RepID=A0A165QS37_EXIGL|nr:PRTase-like protein [Exidia glandulosa HHB12029]